MQLPSLGAAALLNTMRNQISQLRPPNAQQIQQIKAQTGRALQSLESGASGFKGTQFDATA